MKKPRLELTLSVVLVFLTIATAVRPTWIETVTGLDPDAGSGGAEWAVVALLALCAIASGALAVGDFRAAHRLDVGTPN